MYMYAVNLWSGSPHPPRRGRKAWYKSLPGHLPPPATCHFQVNQYCCIWANQILLEERAIAEVWQHVSTIVYGLYVMVLNANPYCFLCEEDWKVKYGASYSTVPLFKATKNKELIGKSSCTGWTIGHFRVTVLKRVVVRSLSYGN